MPEVGIKLVPGVNTSRTPLLLEAGYSESSLVRWQDGLVQKLGGYEKFYSAAVGGVARALHAWQDLNDVDYLAVGTTTLFGAITSSTLTDLTPRTFTSNFTPDFDTVNTTATVSINDPDLTSTVTTYDTVYFDTPIAVGGIILSGLYQIATVTGATTYTITAATNATSTVNNGGAVPTITTASGSASVTIGLTAHGLAVGDKFVSDVSATVGGVTIAGTYVVNTVPTANTFTITSPVTASSTAGPTSINSGEARLTYYIALGPAAAGAGYGIGTYGTGAYGTGIVPTALTGTAITSTDWTFQNWGEIILGCTAGGGIYYWQPNSGFQTASLVSTGPLYNDGIIISMPAQILMAWGSTQAEAIGLQQDPLLIRWCDQEDFLGTTAWTDLTTNQAGSFRIPTGSKVVSGLQAQQQILFWTDVDLWSCSYLGQPLIFSFQKIGSECGLIARHARVAFRNQVYWMGQANFYTGNGTVLPCTVYDNVFQNLNTTYQHLCWAWTNTPFNEVWFFYPSANATECDSYVKFNVVSGAWDYGSLARSCGIDTSVLGNPIAATPGGIIYQHEEGEDADGQPILASFRTGYFKMAEGEEWVFVDKFYPDMKFGVVDSAQSAQIMATFYVKNYSNSDERIYGPYTFTSSTEQIDIRFRGGLVSIQIDSADTGSWWRLGEPRFRLAPDGRR